MTVMRYLTILLCAILASRCATTPAPDSHSQRMFVVPGEEVVKPSPDCPLRIELSGPLPPLIAGTTVMVPLVVRNAGKRSARSCTISGVSIRIRSEADGQWRMVVMQGKTLDAACSHPIRLDSGASESFAREMAVFTNLPPGPATLDVVLGFDGAAYGSRACGEALQWRETVTILPATSGR